MLKQIFQRDPNVTVMIEVHCDVLENCLALDDRRARSVKEVLVQVGISPDRLETISYKTARPVCVEETEECYERNRRVHFVPTQ